MKKINIKQIGIVSLTAIITAVICISGTVYATNYLASMVTYQKQDGTQMTVASALNNLYSKTGSGQTNSLINKEDGLYNKTQKGYMFATNTTQSEYSDNNIISLTNSIEDYVALDFVLEINCSVWGGSWATTTQRIYVSEIKEKYNATNTQNLLKSFVLVDDTGDFWVRVIGCFKDNHTFKVETGYCNTGVYDYLKIKDIIGVK